MVPVVLTGCRLLMGDCLDVLRTMPDCSVDAVVTDPPYGLAFMGKRWDYDVPSVAIWVECLRVLKPGGHLLAFAGTRTQHRMAVRIEDAGFEIRDLIMYCYGSGFPKSHNVAKALGDAACNCGGSALPYTHEESLSREPHAERSVCALRNSDVSPPLGSGQGKGEILQPCLQEQGASLNRAMSCKGEQGRRQSGMERRGDAVQKEGELHRSDLRSGPAMGAADGKEGRLCDAAPAGDGTSLRLPADPKRGGRSPRPQSEQQRPVEPCALPEQRGPQAWGGWPVCGGCGKPMVAEGLGTALKPALEPITMARKPISEGTVAANVLEHGTGALNVDGCRIGTDPSPSVERRKGRPLQREAGTWANDRRSPETYATQRPGEQLGRWPANLIHDGSDEVVGLFPQQQSGGFSGTIQRATNGPSKGNELERIREDRAPDAGSAARFFYTAKASASERQGVAHPTVKPLDLMAYLCRLVTPPNGVVLDPFMGSGTTVKAAIGEGFRAIGIERDPAYFAMAEHRINGAQLGLIL